MITDINQLQLTQNSTSSFKFFYTPFFDKSIYHITITATCINENEVNQYSDHTFYHQFEEVNYKITCCLISPKVIYEDIFGINYIDISSQALTFNNNIKDILETELVFRIELGFHNYLSNFYSQIGLLVIFFINCINDYSFFYFNIVRLFLYFNHVYLIKR